MQVVTYCIMSNHFHLLVGETDRESVASLDAETVIRRIGILYDSFTVRTVQEEWERARAAGDASWEEEILDRYRNRMEDLKQRYCRSLALTTCISGFAIHKTARTVSCSTIILSPEVSIHKTARTVSCSTIILSPEI